MQGLERLSLITGTSLSHLSHQLLSERSHPELVIRAQIHSRMQRYMEQEKMENTSLELELKQLQNTPWTGKEDQIDIDLKTNLDLVVFTCLPFHQLLKNRDLSAFEIILSKGLMGKKGIICNTSKDKDKLYIKKEIILSYSYLLSLYL